MNKMNLPIDEYNRQFDEDNKGFVGEFWLPHQGTCVQCGRHYIAFCVCDNNAREILCKVMALINTLPINPAESKAVYPIVKPPVKIPLYDQKQFNSNVRFFALDSKHIRLLSDAELYAQRTYWLSIYNNAGNTEEETHKANNANWYATLCYNEIMRRRTGHYPK